MLWCFDYWVLWLGFVECFRGYEIEDMYFCGVMVLWYDRVVMKWYCGVVISCCILYRNRNLCDKSRFNEEPASIIMLNKISILSKRKLVILCGLFLESKH